MTIASSEYPGETAADSCPARETAIRCAETVPGDRYLATDRFPDAAAAAQRRSLPSLDHCGRHDALGGLCSSGDRSTAQETRSFTNRGILHGWPGERTELLAVGQAAAIQANPLFRHYATIATTDPPSSTLSSCPCGWRVC
jgi:hypothetical protein